MRDFLDAILAFIGAESLTDLEFDGVTVEIPIYDQDTYDALAEILEAREAISSTQERLVAYYKARGVEVTANSTAKTNIFLGADLS